MIRITKNEIRALIRRIESKEFGVSFRCVKNKNGRGDYGVTETYFAYANPLVPLWAISYDGARLDTHYYINPELQRRPVTQLKIK